MFAQIVIDCQTQKETVSCDYCIAKENCHLRLELEDKTGAKKELSGAYTVLLYSYRRGTYTTLPFTVP